MHRALSTSCAGYSLNRGGRTGYRYIHKRHSSKRYRNEGPEYSAATILSGFELHDQTKKIGK